MKPSPEERLLTLIRGKPTQAPAGAGGPSARAGEGAPAAMATSGTVPLSPSLRWPKLVTGGLCAVLVMEVIYLAIQIIQPLPEIAMPAIPEPPLSRTAAGETPAAPPPPPEMPSLAASASRPLFVSSAAAGPATSPSMPTQAAPSSLAKAVAARLTLLGIVAGDPPQVVIEDSETKKTYFVSTGQSVVEGAVVEQVLDNRVILDLAGEKIDLSL